MRYYFAPMEGITGYVHRNAFHSLFPGVDKYFTAFIAPNQKGKFSAREKKDIAPEHNEGMCVVPQLLTNNAEDFILTAGKIKALGYDTVNLNLGCPSRTVAAKYRGSGFLEKREELNRFLEEIFNGADVKISIKTRIGKDEPEEFVKLLDIYNQYPIEELIVHPRTQRDYYKNTPNWDVFAYALANSKNPVCYNGDIAAAEDYRKLRERFPELDKVMIGRGLLANPGLIQVLEGGGMPDKETLRAFHDRVYAGYLEEMSGPTPALFKMKELWTYMSRIFADAKKPAKRIRKAEKLAAYEAAVDSLFRECQICDAVNGMENMEKEE